MEKRILIPTHPETLTNHNEQLPFPYNLPLWRRRHWAQSPDGRHTAEIAEAWEVSMGNPTSGTLTIDGRWELPRCNPSFIWSDDSRYLAVPQFFVRALLFRRQRVILIDIAEWTIRASRVSAAYFQPESFTDGLLRVTAHPFRGPRLFSWRFPEAMPQFCKYRSCSLKEVIN